MRLKRRLARLGVACALVPALWAAWRPLMTALGLATAAAWLWALGWLRWADRRLLWVAYNHATIIRAPGARTTDLFHPGRYPIPWAAWARIPYAGLIGMQRNGTAVTHAALVIVWMERIMAGALAAFVLILALVFALAIVGRLRGWWKRRPVRIKQEHVLAGSSTWADASVLASYERGGSSVVLGQVYDPAAKKASGARLALSPKLATQGALIVAPPGAGKSVGAIGTLLELEEVDDDTSSKFMWDPKGELARTTARHLKDCGYEVVILHAYGGHDCINPLVYCDQTRFIKVFLEAIIANSSTGVGGGAGPYYTDLFKGIAQTAIAALRDEKGDAATCVDLHERLCLWSDERVLAWLRSAAPGSSAAEDWGRYMTGDKQQFGRLRATIRNRLDVFSDEAVQRFVSGHDLPLDRLLKRHGAPLAVYYIIPSATQEGVGGITASVLALLFAKIGEYAEGAQLERTLEVVLDEAGSGAPVPGLITALATLRGAGVSITVILQFLSQLVKNYGDEGAAAIRNACGHWIGYAGMAVEDAKAFEERLGYQLVEIEETTITPQKPTKRNPHPDPVEKTTTRTVKRPLLAEHEIRRLPNWVALVVPRNTEGFLVKRPPYFERVALAERAATGLPKRIVWPSDTPTPPAVVQPTRPTQPIQSAAPPAQKGAQTTGQPATRTQTQRAKTRAANITSRW